MGPPYRCPASGGGKAGRIWARAMPIDTAVAATSSETASASVANISTPARRRLAHVFSAMGDAKPAVPVSSVMIVVLVSIFGESVCLAANCRQRRARVRPDFVEAVEEGRRFRDFG